MSKPLRSTGARCSRRRWEFAEGRAQRSVLSQLVACSSAYAYGTPTDFIVNTPEYDTVSAAQLQLDTTTSDSDARMRIACLNPSGFELAQSRRRLCFRTLNKRCGLVRDWIASICAREREVSAV
jgi:hypothetical protein